MRALELQMLNNGTEMVSVRAELNKFAGDVTLMAEKKVLDERGQLVESALLRVALY